MKTTRRERVAFWLGWIAGILFLLWMDFFV